MSIENEIRKWFANGEINSAYELSSVCQPYIAYVIITQDEFGVAFPYEGKRINEDFAHARLYSDHRSIAGIECDYLFLTSDVISSRNEFASICAGFVNPGINGFDRKLIISDPAGWWKRWKSVIGNSNSEKHPYAVLAELLMYEYLRNNGVRAKWTGGDYSLHDIQSDGADYEVKSSLAHHGKKISVNGEFQMTSEKDLYICYFRFEDDVNGISIDDVAERLIDNGEDEGELNRKLERQGYRSGNSSRKIRYRLIESVQFLVDEDFPCIRAESFKGDRYPDRISNITYVLSLEGLPCTQISIDNL